MYFLSLNPFEAGGGQFGEFAKEDGIELREVKAGLP